MGAQGQMFICFVLISLIINAECTTNILMAVMKLLQAHPQTSMPMNNTCKPNCCSAMKCPTKMKCMPHQKMKPNAGSCGCCPKCMTQLSQGSPCHPKPKHPMPKMPSSECGCGMQCKGGKCCK
ncbi:fungal protease inhibitor-1 [Parasteatoda tepidariorum]|uniref:fungal protease inhibitor-1 n=1 Tax=Parasteatoda tepidariorum TaxID=114398 RepID=UPI00077F8F95|nr:fungal protease inhibitor-1 [Parasteatoda tepidariorum]